MHDYTTGDLDAALAHARKIGRSEGIDKLLKEYDIDVIIGPAESAMPTIAAASGKKTSNLLTQVHLPNNQSLKAIRLLVCHWATLTSTVVRSVWLR